MEEKDFAASMLVMIIGVDGEMINKGSSMNKVIYGRSYNVIIAEGIGTQKLIVGIKINK